jgi:N-carbamoylputrescine amidase
MHKVTVAATQMACTWDIDANIAKAEHMVRQAADDGCQVVLLQELFETPYFCIEQHHKHFELASSLEESKAINHFSRMARKLKVVLPISWFEKSGPAYFNSLAMIDADGAILGVYRKSHIPNDVAYQEKQYFSPGDTGFKVWDTRYGKIGVGICWDQWFPEAARCMTLQGAQILLYPTAIGSEPLEPQIDSAAHWRTVMCGHAGANLVPVVASNRIGTETATQDAGLSMTFYGNSFIADHFGQVAAQANRDEEQVISHTFDLDECRRTQTYWGVFRDRRPDLYDGILTYDGNVRKDKK